MTAVASPERLGAAAAAPRPAILDRVLPLLPLVAAYLLVVAFLGWHASAHSTPWLFSDEMEYTQLSRSIAEDGSPSRRGEDRGFTSLYTVVLAPVWWIDDTETAYEAAKLLGVLLMASAAFPAYALARMLVPRGWALFAAVGTISIPAMGYSRLLITEPLAYPFAALTFFLVAKAIATWRRSWLVAALLALFVAPYVRQELRILFPAALVAAAVALWLGDGARRLRSGWRAIHWAGAVAVGLLGLLLAHELGKRVSGNYYLATTLEDRAVNFATWATGSFTIGLGILPAVAALTALWRPHDARTSPEYRAFVGLLFACIPAFVLYTTLKATYLSTVFGDVTSERNVIYLAPLLFTATALVFHRPVVNPLVLAAAVAVVGWLIVKTPFSLDRYPYADAPGLSMPAFGNRELSLDDAAIESRLLWILAGSAAILLGAWLLRRARVPVAPALGVVAALVVSWNIVASDSFGDGINHFSDRLLQSVPEPPDWVEAHTGGAPTIYLGQGIADANPVLLTEFWNRSVKRVATLDASAPGPGPTPTLVPYDTDGSMSTADRVDYVVTDGAGVDVFGTEVERTGVWRLIRTDGELRLRSSFTGVYPDGWTGAAAAYSRFGTGARGTVDVLVSRAGWAGIDRPAKVTIRVGELVTPSREVIENPCRGSVCRSTQPSIGRVYAVDEWTARARQSMLFHFPVRTPFRVEITVSPTFSPAEFGPGDGRQLGVQLAVAFKPAPS